MAVLLDLDRTLVDLQSFTDYDAAWAEVRGLVDPLLAESGPVTGWTSSTRACMSVISALPAGDLWQRVSGIIESYERSAVARSVSMPGAQDFLTALAARPRAVVTLLPDTVAREVLAAHRLEVAVVIGRDPGIRPKPSGDGLRVALSRLGVDAARAVMVGDSTWDAGAAADAGVRFVGVHAPEEEFAGLVPSPPVCGSLADAWALVGLEG